MTDNTQRPPLNGGGEPTEQQPQPLPPGEAAFLRSIAGYTMAFQKNLHETKSLDVASLWITVHVMGAHLQGIVQVLTEAQFPIDETFKRAAEVLDHDRKQYEVTRLIVPPGVVRQ